MLFRSNGTPLLQMAVFSADGSSLAPRGPLRVVSLGRQASSPVQLLVTNEGVAPARISLSLRADPPVAAPASPAPQSEGTPLPAPQPSPEMPAPQPPEPPPGGPSEGAAPPAAEQPVAPAPVTPVPATAPAATPSAAPQPPNP